MANCIYPYLASKTNRFAPGLLLISLVCLAADVFAEQATIEILNKQDLLGWEEKSFQGHTQYQRQRVKGRSCLLASASGSASGLFKEQSIDLNKTPILNWEWWIEDTLGEIDETSKAGDDYAARVYVVISGGLFFWKTRALNYVWSSSHAKGQYWPNAYTDNAMMLALQAGKEKTGTWVREKRNIKDDIWQYLRIEADTIDALAIMTDTDNSGKTARACYGRIYFSAE